MFPQRSSQSSHCYLARFFNSAPLLLSSLIALPLSPLPLSPLPLSPLSGPAALAAPFPQPTLTATIEPPGKGEPAGTKGGGSRSAENACLASMPPPFAPFTALSPVPIAAPPTILTSRDRPSFIVYTPATTAQSLEFSLLDDQANGIYQTTLPLPSQAGFRRITLPPTAPALTLGKTYHWTAALVCNPSDRTEDWVIHSTIQRTAIAPALQRQLRHANAIEQINLYLKQQLWDDAIVALIDLHTAQPADPAATKLWSEILQAAGFSRIDSLAPTITTLKP